MNSIPQKFIITCAPRTGSTMLRMMLDSHPDIVCYGEVMALEGEPNLGKKYQQSISQTSKELAQIRQENPVKFLYDYVWSREDCQAIGLKIKYRQLEEQFKDIFTKILDDKEVRIVHLTRQNLLKRYVSNRLAGSGKTSTVIFESDDSKTQPKLQVNIEKCLGDIQSFKQAEARFREYFNQHDVLEVTYEDLVLSSSEVINQLLKFLNVELINLKPVTEKVNSDNLEDIVENYGELVEQLKQTPYAAYI